MKRTIIELDAPAFWANYLVNKEAEGLDKDEHAELLQWLSNERLAASQCGGITEDECGIGLFDYPLRGTLQCELFTYYFLIEGESK